MDLPEKLGTKVLDYTVIGNDDDIIKYINCCKFIVTLGFIKNPLPRIHLHEKIINAGGSFATLIAPSAHVSKYAEIGEGTVIMNQACVNAGAKIGFGCIINTFSDIEHNVVIGDYTHVSTGAMINGDCKIGDSCFIGSQSVMVNGVNIVSGGIIGAGAEVRKDITLKGLYAGNPASLKTLL